MAEILLLKIQQGTSDHPVLSKFPPPFFFMFPLFFTRLHSLHSMNLNEATDKCLHAGLANWLIVYQIKIVCGETFENVLS